MLNIAIVDHDEESRKFIKKEIDTFLGNDDTEYRTYIFKDVEHLFETIDSISFDIILLDIEMPGINGLKAAEILRNNHYPAIIIFVTSKVSSMREAFGLNVFDFIDKKDLKYKLPKTLKKCIDVINKTVFIALRTNDGILVISKHDIIYATLKDRKVAIYTRYETYQVNLSSLRKLCERLKSKDFIYINRNIIINLSYLIQVGKEEVVLKHIEKSLPISGVKYKEINNELLKWISNRGIL